MTNGRIWRNQSSASTDSISVWVWRKTSVLLAVPPRLNEHGSKCGTQLELKRFLNVGEGGERAWLLSWQYLEVASLNCPQWAKWHILQCAKQIIVQVYLSALLRQWHYIDQGGCESHCRTASFKGGYLFRWVCIYCGTYICICMEVWKWGSKI